MSIYGPETKKAIRNFPFSVRWSRMEFMLAIVKIKKAAAIANRKAGSLNEKTASAINKACNEIIQKPDRNMFPLPFLQGGAGTANHMNVNEAIARLASTYLGKEVHPNNHVNLSQSTNDVNPSALRIAALSELKELRGILEHIVQTLEKKAEEFRKIHKLGRTHLADAVPTTLGEEFKAYAYNLRRHVVEIRNSEDICRVLNLGGTAIGNSINAKPRYIRELYQEISKLTGIQFLKAPNLMSKTGSQTDFLMVSQKITALAVDLSKIASDLRFMSSGPRGGIAEIILPELQKGSSIMPGKVNPVMPEAVNQLYYLISGNNVAIEKAVEGAQMELGVMLPIIVEKLLESIELMGEVLKQFDELCLKGIKADINNCRRHLENSTAYATLFTPVLGYDAVAEMVKKSVKTGKTFREVAIGNGYIAEKEFNKVVSSYLKA